MGLLDAIFGKQVEATKEDIQSEAFVADTPFEAIATGTLPITKPKPHHYEEGTTPVPVSRRWRRYHVVT